MRETLSMTTRNIDSFFKLSRTSVTKECKK